MRLSELTNEAEQPSAPEVKSYKKLVCSAENAFEAYAVFKIGLKEVWLATSSHNDVLSLIERQLDAFRGCVDMCKDENNKIYPDLVPLVRDIMTVIDRLNLDIKNFKKGTLPF